MIYLTKLYLYILIYAIIFFPLWYFVLKYNGLISNWGLISILIVGLPYEHKILNFVNKIINDNEIPT